MGSPPIPFKNLRTRESRKRVVHGSNSSSLTISPSFIVGNPFAKKNEHWGEIIYLILPFRISYLINKDD